MAKPKAMYWWPERWKGNPYITAMSSATRSGYREILDAMWLAEGSLPDDDEVLFANSRMTRQEWRKGRAQIRQRLVVTGDGNLSHELILEQYEKAVERMEAKSEGGKKGAEKRWLTHKIPIDKNKGQSSNAYSDSSSIPSSDSFPDSPDDFQATLEILKSEHPGSYKAQLVAQYLSSLTCDGHRLEDILSAHRDAQKVWAPHGDRIPPDLEKWLATYSPENKLVAFEKGTKKEKSAYAAMEGL